MKVKNTIKKVGAAAGSALMVGMTMGAAASLADFPQPFVADDGQVMSQIVVGSQGKQADVVGAINVAAALGQQAVQTETRTVSASGGSYSWSASGGETLDTGNDNLYFQDKLDTVRSTLTADHLDALGDTTFTDDAGQETDVEYFLYSGSQTIEFGQPDDASNQDPQLHVENPANPGTSDYLFQLQANFQNTLNFSGNSDVLGEEINLFGNEYTISESDTVEDELVLFGSTQTLSLQSGETGTITVNDVDHTIAVEAVNSDGVVYSVDGGSLQQKSEGDQFTVEGETVRIDNVINLKDDAGGADFEIGSEELHLMNGEKIEDSNGDDVDGTYVEFNDGTSDTVVDQMDTLKVYVGAEDDDNEFVAAGSSYTHELFGNYEFHFGGLTPDAGEGASANVEEVEFGTSGDDTVTASFTDDGGDSASFEWAHSPDPAASNPSVNLADADDDAIHPFEGTNTSVDEYLVSDAGDFPHLWEVTDVDADSQAGGSGEEATVQLRDVVSGSTTELDLDWNAGNSQYQAEEVVDGQTVHVTVNTFDQSTSNDDSVSLTWGDGADFGDAGDVTSVFPALDTTASAALALTAETAEVVNATTDTVALPSTESTSQQTNTSAIPNTGTFEVGNVVYGTANSNADNMVSVFVNASQNLGESGNPVAAGPSALYVQPENEDDVENAYLHTPGVDTSNDEIDAGGNSASFSYSGTWTQATLESNDDVDVSYDIYGTHTVVDGDGQGSVTIHTPNGQAVAGAAYTGAGGDLSAGGSGGGSVEYTAVTGMGQLPDLAMLDSEVTDSVRQSKHLILVGGPAVNSLVADLASDGKTWTQQQWLNQHQDEALLQVVNDAFTTGQHAMVVAGYGASDTRAAARYVSNYADHSQALSDAGNQKTLTQADYPAQ